MGRIRLGAAALLLAAALTTGVAAPATATSTAPTGSAGIESVRSAAHRAAIAVQRGAAASLPGTAATPPGAGAAIGTGVSRGSGVRVRSTPITGAVRAHLGRGESTRVLCRTRFALRDGWFWARVRRADGVTGWVRTDLLAYPTATPLCP
ncbi:hypothetical protein [Actinokineospora terrae]|uniref:SH3 domain-containing protein n=1 Tax=Actinokineospora terrae TaxID=155974 RepID=A0A1H9MA69_9PSEU|nr:hypothetical protein [Actinokineospora terrae]SER20023.1 hypothetical protein SAMN04487818_10226 [Actinokineospora terrae]